MKRLALWMVRLYPGVWRKRYGRELGVVLEDSGFGWLVILDLLKGAINMQLTTWGFGKLAAALGAAGLIVAGVISAFIPSTYVSTTTMLATAAQIQQVETKVLTRRTLAGVEADLDLYPSSRKTQPLEDVIDKMRKDIGISRVSGSQGSGFTMSFAYPDPAKAQKTLQALVSKMPQGQQILHRPNFSLEPIKPNRYVIACIGLVAGLLLAIAAKLIARLRLARTPAE